MSIYGYKFFIAFLCFSSLMKCSFSQDNEPTSPLLSSCTISGSISGGSCIGSVLTLSANQALKSIKWSLNNSTTLYQQTAGFEKNATVIAGEGNGPALNQLNNPNRFFVDGSGDIYIPDMTNNRVVKWTPGAASGVVVAGGNGGGNAGNQFNRPTAVVVDQGGNLYVADQNNSRIQKWAPGATSGSTFTSQISSPTALTIDKDGNIYASAQSSNQIWRFTPAGGTGTIVAGNSSQLSSPTGIFVDEAKNIYICDTDNNRIVRWASGASSGVVVAGGNGYGSGSNQLANPLGICVDKDGTLFISDYNNNRVQKWNAGAASGTTLAGTGVSGSNVTQLTPLGIYLDPGRNLIVGDYGNGRILKFANNILYRYTALQAGTYTATIESNDNCFVTSNEIVIAPPLTPQISISSNLTVICSASMPVFTANPVDGGSAPKYQWKINGVSAGTPTTDPVFTPLSLNDKDKISCEMTSNAICLQNSTASSNVIDIVKGDESKIPVISINADKQSSCDNSSFFFNASTSNEGPMAGYIWMINGVQHAGSNQKNLNTDLKDGDEVCCVLDTKLPCMSPVYSNTIKVSVNAAPQITLVKDTTVVWGKTFVLTPYINGEIKSANWSPSTGLSDADILNPLVTPHKSGVYTLQVTSDDGCQSSAAININVEHSVLPPKTFSPNGDNTNDSWLIEGLAAFPNCEVTVFNRSGLRVFRSVGYNTPWDGTHSGSPVMAGPYYYIIKLDQKETLTGNINIIR